MSGAARHPVSIVSLGRMPYGEALALQERLVALRQAGRIGDAILLLEHPPVLTLGVRGDRSNILATPEELERAGVTVFPVNRGGDVTYHGPGQLVGYPILDLPGLSLGVREYVHAIEDAVICDLSEEYGIPATRADQKFTGVWVGNDKICAIGIAVQHGVTMHGFAFNVATDLSHFDWIVPCGLVGKGVTSVEKELGRPVDADEARLHLSSYLCRALGLSPVYLSRKEFLDALPSDAPLRKPDWLKIHAAPTDGQGDVHRLIADLGLHTVCESAACPNRRECFGRRTATFMILGDVCTRDCTFCAVGRGRPAEPDPEEPAKVAEAIRTLGLKHCVVTSVTRDDLPDGGAAHFAAVVRAIRAASPETTVEVLIPDFRGDAAALQVVLDSRPDVLNHNVETVPRLYPEVRPSARFARSVELLRRAAEDPAHLRTKSGIMVGLGETRAEMHAVFKELRAAGCQALTIGQYLAPSRSHHAVVEYVRPEVFEEYHDEALALGFSHVASGPFVRSSYRAEEALESQRNITLPY